jgi:hypothetical protein
VIRTSKRVSEGREQNKNRKAVEGTERVDFLGVAGNSLVSNPLVASEVVKNHAEPAF